MGVERSDRDRLEGAHAVLGELGYALKLEEALGGWNATIYPMADVGALRELVAHASDHIEAAELAVAYVRCRMFVNRTRGDRGGVGGLRPSLPGVRCRPGRADLAEIAR
jgi:hypothetical protein